MADASRSRGNKSDKSKERSKSGESKERSKSSKSKSATEAPAPPRAPERKPKGAEPAKKAANIAKSFAKAVTTASARIGRISSDHLSRLAKTAADATKAYKLSRAAAKEAKEEAKTRRNSADTRKAEKEAAAATDRAKKAENEAARAKKEAEATVLAVQTASAQLANELKSQANAAVAQRKMVQMKLDALTGVKPTVSVVPRTRAPVESQQAKDKKEDDKRKEGSQVRVDEKNRRSRSLSIGNTDRAKNAEKFKNAIAAQRDRANGTLVSARESLKKLRIESFERRKEQVGKGLDAAEDKKRRKSAAPNSAEKEEVTAGDLSGGKKVLSEQELDDKKLVKTLTMMMKDQLDDDELVKDRIRQMVLKTNVIDESLIDQKVENIYKMVKGSAQGSAQLKEHLVNFLFNGGPSLEALKLYSPEQIVLASQMMEDQLARMKKETKEKKAK